MIFKGSRPKLPITTRQISCLRCIFPVEMQGFNYQDHQLREVFPKTRVLRKPITGIISGYHELPYVLIAPDDENPRQTIEVNGKISVSPRFIITPQMLGETFGEVFDPETFSEDLQGRLFSFHYGRRKNVKVESGEFNLSTHEENAQDRLNRVMDKMMASEDVRTGLVYGPAFKYYPVSIDRYISEILEREFSV